jgi:hypothetical protein
MLVRKEIKCGGNDKGVWHFVEFNAGRPEMVCQPNSRQMVHTMEKSIRSECLKDVEYIVE